MINLSKLLSLAVLAVSVASIINNNAIAKNIAIVDATVHTMTEQGTLTNATVLISEGKIQTILTETPALTGYEIIDGKGKVVTPGLIGAYTSLGLVEVSSSAGTVDSSSSDNAISKTGAAYDVSYALNPNSSLMAISRIEGITSAATSMNRTGQLFTGQGAIITLGQGSSALMKKSAFVSTGVDNGAANNSGGSRAALWVALERALDEASYVDGKTFNPQSPWYGISSLDDAIALIPVIKGDIPLMIAAHREADLLQVIALKKRHPKLDVVVLYATEGWKVAEQLAQADIAVILNPESNLPYEFDQLAATMENAGRLQKAGVIIAIGMNTHNIRLAKQHAGNAVSHGLPWDAGLAALTINPAKIFGIDDKVGSLSKGKQADVVVWSGDPMEVAEGAEVVIINGELVEMTSRQTKLRDRYLQPSNGKSVHYTRP
ncbi:MULTISPECIES: amidohydrolase family protein [Aliiglaciecola]|uniref:amidohydrolase family protein n=1 Tax=Aliiglaciecola TaxID=1406885 RepID=UPI001C08651D|nr:MULTISPECIES: amidohydrolase family protein [Aliiglaciecola]MBU2878464.1 amidohydrolase family protein [Aliiglaciecola lipolytica]MDO6713316.1 amidohydrolase family protein [Aliiglaciecola sp. 2_MG-2023]MDO6754506.1 amidohydrolase family protein [Aliiglaciecola sp. 1_MG-2023]